jgi:uncharacterized membrane protein YccC
MDRSEPDRSRFSVRDWLRRHDPGYTALRRAGRTALIMPAMFAIGDKIIANPEVATFAAFGAFAMLLLVDFSGPMRQRLQAQAALGVICCLLIALGTLASRTTWVAACAMGVVGFLVVFGGILSSTLAAATTTMLLAFILPVSLPGPISSIPDRIAGWGMSAAVSLLAIWLLWPTPERNPVRGAAIRVCRAVSARLRAEVAYALSDFAAAEGEAHDAAVEQAAEAVSALNQSFFATPYPPTGLSTAARTIVRLVEELRWVNTVALRASPDQHASVNPHACAVKRCAAAVLERVADLLDAPAGSAGSLEALQEAVDDMQSALADLERTTTLELPGQAAAECRPEDDRARVMISALDPSFRAQELSFVVSQIAENTEYAVAADRRNWMARWLGRQPRGGHTGTLAAARRRAGQQVERNAVWLQNSLRAAAALGLAVLVADITSVQHGFWVVFGTLSVLRSNALGTGDNVLRALLGTTAGFIVGGALVAVIGTNSTVLWALLPFAVLLAGLAPAAVSYTAGQAAFTLTLLILFNILQPAGLKVGLVRIEDIALGGAVSLAVGLLFWPRGAGGALGRALSEAYMLSVNYLAAAVAYGSGRCDSSGPPALAPEAQARQALAAARRLDEAFRGYLSERGAKPMSLAEMTGLVTGVAAVRQAADAVHELWQSDTGGGGDRRAARRELLAEAALMTGWYDTFAASLGGSVTVPLPMGVDHDAGEALVEAVGGDLRADDGEATATGVRVIWTSDHLDAVRRLQDTLVGPARKAADEHALA